MVTQHIGLNELGWNDWFAEREDCRPCDTVARVIAVDRDKMLLIDQIGSFQAKLAGSYRYHHDQSQELPCVGDWVCVEKGDAGGYSTIHSLLKRKTVLSRKLAGEAVKYQNIAANVDYVVIVQSSHFDFNLKRLERYLVMISEGGAQAYVVLTKTDLVDAAVVNAQLSEIRAAGITAPVLALSNVTQQGMEEIRKCLLPTKTYCFVGSSGVGKSTLINHLIGREAQETKTVSDTGEGRHTTVRRELIVLDSGALVIDTPGMREFGILAAAEGIDSSFSDIISLASNCRYRDCSHTKEPHCAVIDAVTAGEISKEHYENYLKLKKETEFYSMSYAEKRKKERDFGRHIKSVMKPLKDESMD